MNVFDRLGRHVAGEQDALRSRSSGRARVRDWLSMIDPASKPRFGRPARFAIAVLALFVVAAGVFAFDRERRARASLTATFGASNEPATVGIWLEAPEASPLPLRFSDGTQIDMAPGSRARLVELAPGGAHLLLEVGEAHVTVARKPRASWLLSVGPFAVHVTGTRFDVRWDPDLDAFELSLDEGQVELSGCLFGNAHRLSPGERARASCKRAYFEIVDRKGRGIGSGETPVSLAEPAKAAPPVPAQPVVAPRRGDASRSAAREQAATWRELAEDGKYAEALAAASEAGFDSQCTHASADELALLGDVARYAGDSTKATRALQLLRRRFPGTGRAATAAFTLGRLEFETPGSFPKAADWFRTYLKEQPNGPLARETRGRLLEALHRAGDDRAAHEVALQYLRDYPSGPHATLARDIRGSGDP